MQMEKLQAEKGKGSQLKANQAALTLKCQVCLQQFICTVRGGGGRGTRRHAQQPRRNGRPASARSGPLERPSTPVRACARAPPPQRSGAAGPWPGQNGQLPVTAGQLRTPDAALPDSRSTHSRAAGTRRRRSAHGQAT
jgi:hypothetical protein